MLAIECCIGYFTLVVSPKRLLSHKEWSLGHHLTNPRQNKEELASHCKKVTYCKHEQEDPSIVVDLVTHFGNKKRKVNKKWNVIMLFLELGAPPLCAKKATQITIIWFETTLQPQNTLPSNSFCYKHFFLVSGDRHLRKNWQLDSLDFKVSNWPPMELTL